MKCDPCEYYESVKTAKDGAMISIPDKCLKCDRYTKQYLRRGPPKNQFHAHDLTKLDPIEFLDLAERMAAKEIPLAIQLGVFQQFGWTPPK